MNQQKPKQNYLLSVDLKCILLMLMTSPEEDQQIKEQLRVAEIINGRAAMLGFVALLGSYLTTGHLVPGYF